ncbi:MAG: type II toxin-antitoxin system VapC family toxin [Tepidisphaeraceae bacterium]
MRALLDTSVLLRVSDRASAEHATCIALLQSLEAPNHEKVICTQVLIEYWVVATRPIEVNGLGISPAEANSHLSDFLNLMPCLAEPPDVLARWRTLVAMTNTRGRPAHDARLVAVMTAHGITDLVTLNAPHFGRFPQVRCYTPAQMIQPPPHAG